MDRTNKIMASFAVALSLVLAGSALSPASVQGEEEEARRWNFSGCVQPCQIGSQGCGCPN
jgi:hypothetical protein